MLLKDSFFDESCEVLPNSDIQSVFGFKEMEGMEGEGFGGMKICCLDNKMGGKGFGGEGLDE